MREPVALDGESEGRAESLRRALARNDRFGFYLVLVEGEARAAILARLAAWGASGEVPRLERLPFGPEGVEALRARLATRAEGPPGWLVPDGDALVRDEGRAVLEALNVARDQLWERVGGPLVVLLAPALAKGFMDAAPDLYEVRRGTWQLRALAPQRMWELAQEGAVYDEAFLREWQARLDEDERAGRGQPSAWVDARVGLAEGWARLGRSAEAEAQLTRAEALAEGAGYHAGRNRAALARALVMMRAGKADEAEAAFRSVAERAASTLDFNTEVAALSWSARFLRMRGEYDAAKAILMTAREHAEGSSLELTARIDISIAQVLAEQGRRAEALSLLRDELAPRLEATDLFDLLATTWGVIADLLRDQGDLSAAERVFSARVIPGFERANRPVEVAKAALRLGDILEFQGRLDEALRLHREVALPVFERHGDVRERAITLGKIADVLELKGDRAQAFRLRSEEELPAFERLGDRRERTAVLGKIARELALRGEPQRAFDLLIDDIIPERERLGDPLNLASAQEIIAEVLLMMGKASTALGVLEHDVIPIFRAHQLTFRVCQALLKRAVIQAELGEGRAARMTLVDEVIPLATRMGATELLRVATHLLRRLSASPHAPLPRRARRAAARRRR